MAEYAGKDAGAQSRSWETQRSKKKLKSSEAVGIYQKDWFQNVKARIDAGEPFAICNADEAEEIFLAMDIPVITKQWWSAVISAKRLSSYYFDLLEREGYDLCRYCVLGLGCTMDNDPGRAPWGGLPRPSIIIGSTDCDAGLRVSEVWARQYGSFLFPIEQTSQRMPYAHWWEKIRDHWDDVIEPHRIDLRVDELKELIKFLEVTTGRTLSHARLRRVMELVNQQEDYFARARDLIARSKPCPVTLADQLANYPPQWHRGTEHGVRLTRMFYEEVREKVEKGEVACPGEKIRLMWIGVGLWANTSFYQYFEENYGATFVCSMYLSIAADGYARAVLHDDPLRTLAGRHVFLGLGDDDWYVKEAKNHQVQGAVQMVTENCRLSMRAPLTAKVLERAGIPVVSISCDNVDARAWDEEKIRALVSDFIEKRILG
ncbi:MAG TPA: 2-hydroxyacyl-CoA dehydratase family protein [Syntrophorhabdaceae bacterium]|nr:2-hydroxyacyl-CoA dehydratase family protein [Syntrophorhabdaceae bacterium]